MKNKKEFLYDGGISVNEILAQMTMVYFASPFFTEEQVEREERLKARLRQYQGFKIFSPKEECFCPPNATNQQRENTYKMNIEAIENCDMIFIVTDGKDVGTIFEAGYICGLNSTRNDKAKVVYYCETLPEGGQFNLMLAQSADVVITDYDDLDNIVKYLNEGKAYDGNIE